MLNLSLNELTMTNSTGNNATKEYAVSAVWAARTCKVRREVALIFGEKDFKRCVQICAISDFKFRNYLLALISNLLQPALPTKKVG